MVTLKNPQVQIPNGYSYIQAETGWDSTRAIGTFPSIDVLTRAVISHREANPWLIQKHGWNVNYEDVYREMCDYNAKRCLEHGWGNFIVTDESLPAEVPVIQKKTSSLEEAAAGVKRVAAGVGLFVDWIGEGGVPVSEDIAERRAAVCVQCPKNDGGDWKKYFTEPIADKIKKQLEIKHDLELKTSLDDKLTVCSACDCPLPLKVWVPLKHVLAHTSYAVQARLDKKCWITAGT